MCKIAYRRCRQCNELFIRRVYEMNKNGGLCSYACANKSRVYTPEHQRRDIPRRKGVCCILPKKCIRCGSKYTPKVNHLWSWKASKFCTKSCSAKRQKGKPQPWGRKPPIPKKCPICGKMFVKRSKADTLRSTYCSYRCLGFAPKENPGGHKYCLISFKKCEICDIILSIRPNNKNTRLCVLCRNKRFIENAKKRVETTPKLCYLKYKKCHGCGKFFTGPLGYINQINHCNQTCFLMSERHANNNPSKFQKEVFEQIKLLEPATRIEFGLGRKYLVDICIPHKKLVIECDGYYWHKGKEEQDLERQLKIESWGFRVVRIPEKEWYKDPNIFRYI